MADRTGLEMLGFIFGGITAAVMLIAGTVVIGHVEGRFELEAPQPAVTISSSQPAVVASSQPAVLVSSQ